VPNVKAKADRRQGYRPNPRRQVIWVVVVLVAVLGGYGFGLLVKDDETPSVAVDR